MKSIAGILLLTYSFSICQGNIEFTSLEISCIDFRKDIPKEIVINSEEEYLNLKNYTHGYDVCSEYQLPKINFREKTLLGLKIIAGGCEEPIYVKEIIRVDNNFIYRIHVTTKGICRRGYSSMQWIVVNKILNAETIKFEID